MQDTIESNPGLDIPTGPTGDPLMLAKLDMPTLPSTTLRRLRLLDRVTAGGQGRLTVVCAPAGCGKTTLMLSWVEAGLSPGPVVWISLDALDRQPGIFWSYLLTGLARVGVSAAGVPAPDHPYKLDPSFLIRLSAALYQRSEPIVVVLDDADAVADSPLCGQLDFLLRNAGPALRLVLLTRDDSAVSLPRHRLAGTVTEIGATELAATPTEAVGLFEQQGLPADVETMDGILRRTRGWMAGLVLTGMALRDPHQAPRAPGEVPAAGDLDEYVDEEVLGAYPPPVRRFLVRTSIADHLPAGLAEELAGQQSAARLLADLARHNAFVTSCEEHLDCYHYHPLLQEVLRARLEEDSPGAGQQLRRRAAAWFLRAGEPTEAAVHAAGAGEWRAAVRMLVDGLGIANLLAGPGSERLAWLLADLPVDVPGAEAAVVRAAVALARQDTIGCAGELAAAAKLAQRAGTEPTAALTLGSSLVAGGLAAATGDTETTLAASATVEKLLGELPPSKELATSHMLALSYGARALLQAGRFEAALVTLDDARRVTAPWCDRLLATCDGLAALAEAMRGRLGRAAELAGAEPGGTTGRLDGSGRHTPPHRSRWPGSRPTSATRRWPAAGLARSPMPTCRTRCSRSRWPCCGPAARGPRATRRPRWRRSTRPAASSCRPGWTVGWPRRRRPPGRPRAGPTWPYARLPISGRRAAPTRRWSWPGPGSPGARRSRSAARSPTCSGTWTCRSACGSRRCWCARPRPSSAATPRRRRRRRTGRCAPPRRSGCAGPSWRRRPACAASSGTTATCPPGTPGSTTANRPGRRCRRG